MVPGPPFECGQANGWNGINGDRTMGMMVGTALIFDLFTESVHGGGHKRMANAKLAREAGPDS
eukprot:1969190-Karenia_brevis.AAC.1